MSQKEQVEDREEPLCISIPAAGRLCGVSRSTAYSMARLGQLPVIKCGQRRLMVPKAALLKMLEEAGSDGSPFVGKQEAPRAKLGA